MVKMCHISPMTVSLFSKDIKTQETFHKISEVSVLLLFFSDCVKLGDGKQFKIRRTHTKQARYQHFPESFCRNRPMYNKVLNFGHPKCLLHNHHNYMQI